MTNAVFVARAAAFATIIKCIFFCLLFLTHDKSVSPFVRIRLNGNIESLAIRCSIAITITNQFQIRL